MVKSHDTLFSFFVIVLFLTVADWLSHYHENKKVNHDFLHTVYSQIPILIGSRNQALKYWHLAVLVYIDIHHILIYIANTLHNKEQTDL